LSYIILHPPEHLRQFVQYFWQAEINLESQTNFTHISTAQSRSGIQFYFDGGFATAQNSSFSSFEKTAIFNGQTNIAQDFLTTGSAGIFGVKFYPYGIYNLFKIPINELTNQIHTLRDLVGQKSSELAERIFIANDFSERVDLLTQFLEGQVRYDTPIDVRILKTIALIEERKGNLNIESLSKNVFLSERQFERNFKQIVGFPPKTFAKIIRFEYAKTCIEINNQSLTDIALSCGYYDQAHLNHDFKTLSGYSPKDYVRNYLKLQFDE
jgi:AraC-like DNA-binding protein